MSRAILAALALTALVGAILAVLTGKWWAAVALVCACWTFCLLLVSAIEHKRGGGGS